MNIATMRGIDYWAGRFLCLVFDGIHCMLNVCRGQSKKAPKNILFMEFSEAGSIVLAYAALKRARTVFADAHIYFLSFAAQRPGLLMADVIDKENIFTVRSENLLLLLVTVAKSLGKIWRRNIDTVIDLELYSRFSSILSFLTFAGNRVGFYQFTGEGLYRGRHLSCRVHYNPYAHISKNFLSLIHALERKDAAPNYHLKDTISDDEVVPWKATPSPASIANAETLIKSEFPALTGKEKIVLVNFSGGQLPLRAWPLEHYTALIRRVLEQHADCIVALIGLADALDDSHSIKNRVAHERLVNLVGKTQSMRDIVDLCHYADILLTNDSGPAHYASLTDIWIIVLFGPETPVLYKPLSSRASVLYARFLCSPCLSAANHRTSACRDNKCLQAIAVEDVYRLVAEKIS